MTPGHYHRSVPSTNRHAHDLYTLPPTSHPALRCSKKILPTRPRRSDIRNTRGSHSESNSLAQPSSDRHVATFRVARHAYAKTTARRPPPRCERTPQHGPPHQIRNPTDTPPHGPHAPPVTAYSPPVPQERPRHAPHHPAETAPDLAALQGPAAYRPFAIVSCLPHSDPHCATTSASNRRGEVSHVRAPSVCVLARSRAVYATTPPCVAPPIDHPRLSGPTPTAASRTHLDLPNVTFRLATLNMHTPRHRQ